MTTTTSQPDNMDESDPFVIRRTWSDDDEQTAPSGKNRDENRPAEHEILVRWQMPGNLTHVDAKRQLIGLLGELLMSYPNDTTFIDQRNREWQFTPEDKEVNIVKEMENASLKLFASKNKQQQVIKWIVITRFRTRHGIPEWKSNDYFYSMVLEAKTFMFSHPFESTVWDIATIGFLKDLHVAHLTTEHVHNMITNKIENKTQTPMFQIIPQRITNKERNATTRAFTVQCARSDSKQLIHMLTHGEFRASPWFIPFKYKATQPDVFTRCIRKQNEVYYKTWVIKLEGLDTKAMTYIEAAIKDIPGVQHLVPTRKIREKGEWKVLVDQPRCSFIHKHLTASWETIMEKIPSDVLTQAPMTWSLPQVSSQKVRDYQDASVDSDSYGSILTTGTDLTVPPEDEEMFNDPPTGYSYPTYAAAAASSMGSAATSTSISSPTISTNSEWQKEKQMLEDMIRQQALQIDKIQADLEAKINRSHDLEEQLAQAIELAHSRDVRHEEMLRKFEMLMRTVEAKEPQEVSPRPVENQLRAEPSSNPKHPPPASKATASPPSKKANNNSTPERQIYPIFKTTPGLAMPPPPRHRRESVLLTQPMDTDDESRKPPPGAKTGKKSE
jgi:hypothetical protein